MNDQQTRSLGLNHGKSWDSLPSDEGPINWSFDTAAGSVQGPLELESFNNQSMMLSLETGQTALLIQDNKLRAIFLDGVHNIQVGHGFNQIPSSASLVFISTAATLQLRWKKDSSVQWSTSGESGLTGHCNLSISNPVAFYESYLHNNTSIAEDHALAEIDATVRTALAEMVGTSPLGGGPTTAAELQSRLACVSAQTLSEDLAAQGLTCLQLNLYAMASHVDTEPGSKTSFAPVHY
jgi:hypothetical protein